MDFLSFLKKYRYSRWKLSRKLKIPYQTVSEWCRGMGTPNANQATTIAVLLGCDELEVYKAIMSTPVKSRYT